MVQFCCILGCGNRSNRDHRKFFRLPIVPKTCKSNSKAELILKRRQQWLDNIDRVDLKDGDSSYSPGYIRVCSDHFRCGKPSSLMDVDHPDWAPTVKMGSGPIKMKGSKFKRQMLGYSLPKRNKRKKLAEQPHVRQIPVITDNQEIWRRRKLAQHAETAGKKKHYMSFKSVKKGNPYRNKLQSVLPTMAKKTFMQRQKLMRGKLSEIENKQHSTCARVESTEVIDIDGVNEPRKCPIIHKITTDTIVLNQNFQPTGSGPISNEHGAKLFDESSNSECGGTFLENYGVKLFDESTNSASNNGAVNRCSVQDLETINELMNGHLSMAKTEIKEEPLHVANEVGVIEELMNDHLTVAKTDIKEESVHNFDS